MFIQWRLVGTTFGIPHILFTHTHTECTYLLILREHYHSHSGGLKVRTGSSSKISRVSTAKSWKIQGLNLVLGSSKVSIFHLAGVRNKGKPARRFSLLHSLIFRTFLCPPLAI